MHAPCSYRTPAQRPSLASKLPEISPSLVAGLTRASGCAVIQVRIAASTGMAINGKPSRVTAKVEPGAMDQASSFCSWFTLSPCALNEDKSPVTA